jgi:hypothetical protein
MKGEKKEEKTLSTEKKKNKNRTKRTSNYRIKKEGMKKR